MTIVIHLGSIVFWAAVALVIFWLLRYLWPLLVIGLGLCAAWALIMMVDDAIRQGSITLYLIGGAIMLAGTVLVLTIDRLTEHQH